jgi:transglutaminase-like putative cysteine protease
MAFVPRSVIILTLAGALVAPAQVPAPEIHAFRSWIAGKEAGGSEQRTYAVPEGLRCDSHEWTSIERMGMSISQDLVQTALKGKDGAVQFTFTLSLSQEPMEGRATWAPSDPGHLKVTFKGLPPSVVDLPAGAVIWPGDEDALLKAAAAAGRSVHMVGYSVPTQQESRLDLEPQGPDPLPGFPGAVRYKGKAAEGPMIQEVEAWISPEQAMVKQVGTIAGIPFLSQRASLPAPAPEAAGPGFFERTLKTVPAHPFLPWVPSVEVVWTGQAAQALPETPCQKRLGDNRYLLSRSGGPSAAGRAERPVQGQPSPEDAPYLAETPLVQFRDPVFAGLQRRLAAPAGATRWELAQLVTRFVYDWILDKDYSVGFASAQEVARNPKGDCTEHGVLAVALLRRLGVPARGVVGWVAMGGTQGLHFWAEARIGGEWIPLDPTFDQAPASAFRIKLGDSDLRDLGSVGWDNASASFQEGVWKPEGPWASSVRIQGDTVHAPGRAIRAKGSRWSLEDGALLLDSAHKVTATARPAPSQPTRLLQGRTGRQGRFGASRLWVDCGEGAWLQVEALTEAEAFRLLDGITFTAE